MRDPTRTSSLASMSVSTQQWNKWEMSQLKFQKMKNFGVFIFYAKSRRELRRNKKVFFSLNWNSFAEAICQRGRAIVVLWKELKTLQGFSERRKEVSWMTMEDETSTNEKKKASALNIQKKWRKILNEEKKTFLPLMGLIFHSFLSWLSVRFASRDFHNAS